MIAFSCFSLQVFMWNFKEAGKNIWPQRLHGTALEGIASNANRRPAVLAP